MKDSVFEKSITHTLVDCVDYVFESVISKPIFSKPTGTVTVFSFYEGERLNPKLSPFDTLVQVIEGEAEVIIDAEPNLVLEGQALIIPAHSKTVFIANTRFKMLSIVIKSGYEDVSF